MRQDHAAPDTCARDGGEESLVRTVRVIGAPRSGTNLVKYLMEANTDFRCVFNLGWWKHAVVPPLFDYHEPQADNTPTVIMFRHPVSQILSFFRFSEKGRSAIYGAGSLAEFIRSPVFMDPPGVFSYRFATPVAYWEQYYYAALRWQRPGKFFLSLEAIKARPMVLLDLLRTLDPHCGLPETVSLPDQYLGRNVDTHVAEASPFEAGTTLEREDADAEALARTLDPSDWQSIMTDQVRSLYAELEESNFSHVPVSGTARPTGTGLGIEADG
jgi:hypothetical protein